MKLKLLRKYENENETLGVLSVDSIDECLTLEDQYQEEKVYGETRIPTGTYNVKLRKSGRLHNKYSKRFPDFHKGMLWLQDVPNFTYIYIHIGNKDEDTLGCILVGERALVDGNGGLTLQNSTNAYIKLYKKVVDAAENGNLTIKVE